MSNPRHVSQSKADPRILSAIIANRAFRQRLFDEFGKRLDSIAGIKPGIDDVEVDAECIQLATDAFFGADGELPELDNTAQVVVSTVSALVSHMEETTPEDPPEDTSVEAAHPPEGTPPRDPSPSPPPIPRRATSPPVVSLRPGKLKPKAVSFSKVTRRVLDDIGVKPFEEPLLELDDDRIKALAERLSTSVKKTLLSSGIDFDKALTTFIEVEVEGVKAYVTAVRDLVGGDLTEARSRMPPDMLLVTICQFTTSVGLTMTVYVELKVAINSVNADPQLRALSVEGKEYEWILSGTPDHTVAVAKVVSSRRSTRNKVPTESADQGPPPIGRPGNDQQSMREVIDDYAAHKENPEMVTKEATISNGHLTVFEVKSVVAMDRSLEGHLNQVQAECIAVMELSSANHMTWVLTDGFRYILGATSRVTSEDDSDSEELEDDESDSNEFEYESRRFAECCVLGREGQLLRILAYWVLADAKDVWAAMKSE